VVYREIGVGDFVGAMKAVASVLDEAADVFDVVKEFYSVLSGSVSLVPVDVSGAGKEFWGGHGLTGAMASATARRASDREEEPVIPGLIKSPWSGPITAAAFALRE